MIDAIIHGDCTGCEACASSCPQKCIEMVADNEGFMQPVVNYDCCIHCKRCVGTCPVLNFQQNHARITDKKQAFAYKNANDAQRWICSSGGVFMALGTLFIEDGGTVYGAAFDEKLGVRHMPAATREELLPLAGSKYLQSRIGETYREIREALKAGRKVLFVGMTCQVEGLLSYLNQEYENLYCIDLICMGIPSPMVWEKYLDTYFNREKITRINFKDKKLGWHRFSFHLEREGGSTVSIPGFDNAYMQCMFKGYSIRPSCFHCRYKCESKRSDMTIADCWGCENYVPEMDDNKGLSMVICHSEKGEYLQALLRKTGEIKPFDYENVLIFNANYHHSTVPQKGRRKFYQLLKTSPALAFKWMGGNPKKSLIIRLKAKIKSIIGANR